VDEERGLLGSIANSWSELATCQAHLRRRAEAVKRGVRRADFDFLRGRTPVRFEESTGPSHS